MKQPSLKVKTGKNILFLQNKKFGWIDLRDKTSLYLRPKPIKMFFFQINRNNLKNISAISTINSNVDLFFTIR
jgi:hypothetical protein